MRNGAYAISPERIRSTDLLQQHKTNWRDLYESEHARLTADGGCDEVVFLNERGEVAEGAAPTSSPRSMARWSLRRSPPAFSTAACAAN